MSATSVISGAKGSAKGSAAAGPQPILAVRDLVTSFRVEGQWRAVVRGVSFEVAPRETVALVGESGSGKSVTALSVMRLTAPGASRVEGSVRLAGRELLTLGDADIRRVRGNEAAMIFQEPMTSLNPVLTIGFQIAEALILHRGLNRSDAEAETVRLLEKVRIPAARSRLHDYPHRFSGGMRQRVMIAMALACRPKLLIADEPTTALDVTIQAQILELIKSLAARDRTAVIMVTHDLGVVAGMCESVCVMYAGRIVEKALVDDLFYDPKHPYTRGLLDSIPRADRTGKDERLYSIPGSPPSLVGMPDACPFHPRCPRAMDICRKAYPPETRLEGLGPRTVSCWLHAKERA
ncbi:MAG TPA: ABC transporter ATP-binding protein [Spirochaetales bacterium]|nr:ABC transporter ATP-binding protein [Spirochaetales bacterium]